MLRCKISSLPFLGLCQGGEYGAQSKEKKGSKFAIWPPLAAGRLLGAEAEDDDGGGTGELILEVGTVILLTQVHLMDLKIIQSASVALSCFQVFI